MLNLQNLQLQQLFLVIIILVYILYQQVALKPVKASKYVFLPLAFTYFTLNTISKSGINLYTAEAPILLLTAAGAISGAASGFITKLSRDNDGRLYQQGGWAAVLFLILTIPVRYGLTLLLGSIPGNEALNSSSISFLILFSSQLVCRSLIVFFRAPEIWDLFLQERNNKKRMKERIR